MKRILLLLLAVCGRLCAESGPAAEPAVIAVSRAMPAVVNINTERVVKHTVRDPYDEFFNQFFGGPMRPPRTFSQKLQSLGSGFLVDPAGFIITNEHVVQRAEGLKISVKTHDGRSFDARYITGAPESDLAFIKIESKESLPFISVTDLSPGLLGETVLVLGNPLGYGSSVSRGILSAKGRTVVVEQTEYKDLIQTDAAINPGNSGGPLVDIDGKLVGVSSVKLAFTPQGVPTQGLGFAIPASVVREKVAAFKRVAAGQKTTKAPAIATLARKYFGLHLQDLTPELSESFGYEADSGLLIADVDAGSAAEEAGMKRGLLIAQVGRYRASSVKQVEELLAAVSAGSRVDFMLPVVRPARGLHVRQLQTVTLTAR